MRSLFVLLASIVPAACMPSADAPVPTFPAVDTVKQLVVNGASISETNKIGEFLVALDTLTGGWSYPFDTYPTPQASVVIVNAANQPICSVYLGTNWLGSNCGHKKEGNPPLVLLTLEQAKHFRSFVGGNWEVK